MIIAEIGDSSIAIEDRFLCGLPIYTAYLCIGKELKLELTKAKFLELQQEVNEFIESEDFAKLLD